MESSPFKSSNVLTRISETEDGRNYFGRNNKAYLRGRINEDLKVVLYGPNEALYATRLVVKTLDGRINYIPVVMSTCNIAEKVLKFLKPSHWIDVLGEFRTEYIDGHKKVFLYAKKVNWGSEKVFIQGKKDHDLIYLKGTICTKPAVRITATDNRLLAEFQLAVKRVGDGEVGSDYIPCSAWSDDATWVRNQSIGANVWLYGVMNSRRRYTEAQIIDILGVSVIEVHTATW